VNHSQLCFTPGHFSVNPFADLGVNGVEARSEMLDFAREQNEVAPTTCCLIQECKQPVFVLVRPNLPLFTSSVNVLLIANWKDCIGNSEQNTSARGEALRPGFGISYGEPVESGEQLLGRLRASNANEGVHLRSTPFKNPVGDIAEPQGDLTIRREVVQCCFRRFENPYLFRQFVLERLHPQIDVAEFQAVGWELNRTDLLFYRAYFTFKLRETGHPVCTVGAESAYLQVLDAISNLRSVEIVRVALDLVGKPRLGFAVFEQLGNTLCFQEGL
jgi:hypothetical protein